jgi:hypothetical protein
MDRYGQPAACTPVHSLASVSEMTWKPISEFDPHIHPEISGRFLVAGTHANGIHWSDASVDGHRYNSGGSSPRKPLPP